MMPRMLNADEPQIALKLDLLERAMPARSAAVFGDMYIVEGAYTKRCAELGCERVALVDTLETPGWLRSRLDDPRIDFFKGDFANPFFMAALPETFTVTVAYDILLHQPPLLTALHLILEKTEERICIVQPMLKERELPNTLVYLPANTDRSLYPLDAPSPEFIVFDPRGVNQSNWIWGITPSCMESMLVGEGFEVTHREDSADLSNPMWQWVGMIAERREPNPHHWSGMHATPGLYEPHWETAATAG